MKNDACSSWAFWDATSKYRRLCRGYHPADKLRGFFHYAITELIEPAAALDDQLLYDRVARTPGVHKNHESKPGSVCFQRSNCFSSAAFAFTNAWPRLLELDECRIELQHQFDLNDDDTIKDSACKLRLSLMVGQRYVQAKLGLVRFKLLLLREQTLLRWKKNFGAKAQECLDLPEVLAALIATKLNDEQFSLSLSLTADYDGWIVDDGSAYCEIEVPRESLLIDTHAHAFVMIEME